MHRFFAPVAIDTVNERSYPFYIEQLRAAQIDRVILCCVGEVASESGTLFEDPARLAHYIKQFSADGFEVGVWMDSLGHGVVLNHAKAAEMLPYSPIVGLDGNRTPYAICPLDPQFRAHYAKALQTVAAMHPDLIMLDDDFRLNTRGNVYNLGCFCEQHMAAFFARIGKELPREELEALLFCGGESPYRTAWLEVQGESLLSFARDMRAAVDQIDPTVRLGACMCRDTWDLDGTDGIEIARAFAGSTKPFLRTIGAPYHDRRIAAAVEFTRMQAAWCRQTDKDVEVSAEGDVYPRPRYNVPARFLELFDLALIATHAVDADQKYMFDYNRSVFYETGYVERHLKNRDLRRGVDELFRDKTPVGVHVFEEMRKMKAWDMAAEKPAGLCTYLHGSFCSRAAQLLAEAAIPTAYTAGDYPVAAFGENARHVPLTALRHGALLDAKAAVILRDRGVDVGLLKAEPTTATTERFPKEEDEMPISDGLSLHALTCAPTVKPLSTLLPAGTPGAYLYENAAGQRFFVLAEDSYHSAHTPQPNYHGSYHRQRQLLDAIPWLCGKPLPAVCAQNPYLYMITSRGEDGSLAVALLNGFEDEIPTPTVTLDRTYASIRFVNCTGKLHGNVVTLSEISPYGFAAFEVSP